jgi:cellulose biosynthesis protein BcsE
MTARPGWTQSWRDALALPQVLELLLGRVPRRARLPVDFLPGEVGVLRRGRPAVLVLGDEATRQSCLRALLLGELAAAPVTWLGADEAQVRALGPQVLEAAQRGRLHAVAWKPGAAAALRERGAGWLLHELASCGLRRRELLVVDFLTPWLAGLGAKDKPAPAVQEAIAALQAWSQRHAGAAVLALAPTHHGDHALLPLLESSSLACVARLQRHGAQVHLEVLRWHSGSTGTVQDLGFGLVERPDGGWQADGSGLALQTHDLVKASDVGHVITLPAALAAGEVAPAQWQFCAGQAELLAACRYAVAATVLLPSAGANELPQLLDTVRQLRRAHPHALKIVVREIGSSMRYNQELALRRAGANTVVYGSRGLEGVQRALDELRHEVFSRRIAEAGDTDLLNDLAPDPVRGYLPLGAFCDAAQRMIDRTAHTDMAHCVVQLPLLPEVSHLDALAACHIGRDGDLVTADEKAVWLFLFACRAPDVEPTLQRLFALPPAALFNQMRVRPQPDSMRRALDRLRQHAVDAVTDYSEALKAVQPEQLQVSDSGFVALQPEGLDTLPAALDEAPVTPAAAAPRPALERIQLKLRP